MAKRDYYEILGLSKGTSDDEIKKAYRKLAMKFHPDRVSHMSDSEKKEAEEKFKELQEAYAVLSDGQKRQMYDQFGHEAVSGNAAGGAGRGAGGFGSASYEDIFSAFGFGDFFKRGGANAPMRGRDMEYAVEITLEESAHGVHKAISYPRAEKCSVCNGLGAKDPTDVVTCKQCHGQGQVRFSQGFFSVQQTCPDCKGAGTTIKNPCGSCRGSGLVRENKKIDVTIPAGVDDGATLRVTGEGEAGLNSGSNGDLYVHIRIKPHNFFTRQGKDLHCEIPISFTQAALGAEIEVPTIEGKLVKLKVPEGTQTGTKLRVKDKGIKALRGITNGDLYCHIFVETPISLTNEQKDLINKLNESLNANNSFSHHPKGKSFVDKFREFFNK